MDYMQLLEQLTPELVASFKRALELGRWPDGQVMTDAQREHCLQAVIAYDGMRLPEHERVGYIDRARKKEPQHDDERALRWDEERD